MTPREQLAKAAGRAKALITLIRNHTDSIRGSANRYHVAEMRQLLDEMRGELDKVMPLVRAAVAEVRS